MNDNDKNKENRLPTGREPDDSAPQEPTFTGFDVDDGYEELDRDTDYSSVFPEDDFEAEEFADTLFDQVESDESQDTSVTGDDEQAAAAIPSLDDELWEEPIQDEDASFTGTTDDWIDEEDDEVLAVQIPPGADPALAIDDNDWQEDEAYDDEDMAEGQTWPVIMIALAVLALVLLGVGGYGVVKQRSATQEEIRQLQASLATAVAPDEAAADREALRASEIKAGELKTQIELLQRENTGLKDTLAGLESQLEAQREALAPGQADKTDSAAGTVAIAEAAVPSRPAPEPAKPQVTVTAQRPAANPIPESTPEPAKPQVTVTAKRPASEPVPAVAPDTGWFVNFASYGKRATADNWAAKLKPTAGDAVVAAVQSNGRTLYRVRIVGLPDKGTADKVAGQLAAKHGLKRLWVGQH